jgi:hypothetical protein
MMQALRGANSLEESVPPDLSLGAPNGAPTMPITDGHERIGLTIKRASSPLNDATIECF